MQLMRKTVVEYDVSYDIRPSPFFGIAMISKSQNGYLSKTLEAHISGIKNYFLLNQYFQSVSSFNKIFRIT